MNKQGTASLLLVLLTMLVPFGFSAEIALAQERHHHNAKTNMDVAATPRLPYSVEVNDESSRKGVVIILAVNAVSTFKCSEAPLQVVFGDPDGLDVTESDPNAAVHNIYVRPSKDKISTNMVIEMKSGPVTLNLRSIERKDGAQVGDYNYEVVVKSASSRSELAAAQAAATKANEQVEKLKTQLAAEQKKQQTTPTQAEKLLPASESAVADLLHLIEAQNQLSTNFTDVAKGRGRLWQLGKPVKYGNGWFVVYEIENRSKDQLSIDQWTANSGQVQGTLTGPRKLPPHTTARIGLYLQPGVSSNGMAASDSLQLTISVSGSTATVKVQS